MPPTDRRYEDLLAAVFEAHERGDAATIDAILAAHPAEAPRLQAAQQRLARAGMLVSEFPYPEQLGEFRLLQRIGGGGMGVVFLAEQTSLRRKVAVKLVRPELMLSPLVRERFQREIATVAQLQHPGIVPVLAIGHHQGVPYFAMEYVAGCSLDEVLLSVGARSPRHLDGRDFARAVGEDASRTGDAAWCAGSWWQVCVRTIAAVADTVAFVHARGILHRDLKPSNVMVTPQGHALLLDFGLAHSVDGERLTRSGAELGSLPYMSPEQVGGEALDERTDVYSLGVTLYQLLALCLPFTATGDGALRAAITAGRTVPLGQNHRHLPPDLQLVVATAIDVDRRRRYASMAAFAADLLAVLAGRPIAARPKSFATRAGRWRRHHPFATGGLAVLALLLLVLPIPIAAREHHRNSELDAARQLAEGDLDEARRAIDLLALEADNLMASRDPATASLRQRMLQQVLAFYTDLAARHAEDADVLRALASVHRALGDGRWQNGAFAAAAQHLALARDVMRKDPAPADRESRLVAAALDGLAGRIALETSAFAEAERTYTRRVATLEGILAEAPTDRVARLALANAHNDLANVYGIQRRRADKLALLRQSLAEKRALIADGGEPLERAAFAMQCNNLAEMVLGQLGGEVEALPLLREATQVIADLPPLVRDHAENRSMLGEVAIALGAAESLSGHDEAALASFARARELFLELRAADPSCISFNFQLTRNEIEYARHLLRRGDHSGAAAAARAGVGIADEALGRTEVPSLRALRGDAEAVLHEAEGR